MPACMHPSVRPCCSCVPRAFNVANAHVAPKCALQVEEVKLGRGKGKAKKRGGAGEDEDDEGEDAVRGPTRVSSALLNKQACRSGYLGYECVLALHWLCPLVVGCATLSSCVQLLLRTPDTLFYRYRSHGQCDMCSPRNSWSSICQAPMIDIALPVPADGNGSKVLLAWASTLAAQD